MAANRLLDWALTALAWVVLPVQLVTTLVLGLLVSVSFGLLAWPIGLLWMVFLWPLVGASWLCSRVEALRNPIGFLGIPWAILANTYVCLMPAMGELEGRAAKLLLTETWPFTWEFRRLQAGTLDLGSAAAAPLRDMLERVSRDDPIKQWTVDRLGRAAQRRTAPGL